MTDQAQARCITLTVDVPSDADMPRVIEVITRTMTGLVLEGLDARVYSYLLEEETEDIDQDYEL